MAGEIQLNGTTALTESSGAITLNNVNSATNRTNLGLGTAATSASTAFASSSTTITAGTGLSGGGNLSTNRTINVSFSANESNVKTAINASGSAPIYACRAWVNFNGIGTPAIRNSGNVSSITDNGTGDFTVNLTTAMSDANYTVVAGCGSSSTRVGTFVETSVYAARTSSAARIGIINHAGTTYDTNYVDVAIFR